MEETVLLIAEIFNKSQIRWALGGSLLLHYDGIRVEPGDIDIIVSERDIRLADRLLSSAGKRLPINTKACYGTRYFFEYVIWDTQIDLMTSLSIAHSEGNYVYTLPEQTRVITKKRTDLYLTALEDWFVLYSLMQGREEKAQLIKKHMLETNVDKSRLSKFLCEQLPANIKEEIECLL